ncbi:MAG: hypothetical protein FGM62_02500 [Methylobacterium sp.]|nr:hypothetical protein [Methylobacterium sp.]
MSWGMMPGESLAELARQIYPHNPAMQQRFAEASLALNRQQLPDLDVAAAFTQPTLLQIPDLRALSLAAPADAVRPQRSGQTGQRQRSAGNGGSTLKPDTAGIDARLNAQIDLLEKRNLALKQQQALLSERLRQLEDKLRVLRTAVDKHRTARPIPKVPAPAAKPDHPAATGEFALPGPLVLNGLALGVLVACGGWFYRHRRSGSGVVSKLIRAGQGAVGQAHGPSGADAPAGAAAFEAAALQKPLIESLDQGQINDHMNVGEIESIVEEARVYVALGRSEQAILMLNDYIESHPRVSVHPWLYLLDLYRAGGRKPEFTALAKRLHQSFNVMAPAWEAAAVAMVVPTSLEEFPHILTRLTGSWGSKDCHDFLNALIQDNRDGERAGFSLEVLEEILLLLALLDLRDTMH